MSKNDSILRKLSCGTELNMRRWFWSALDWMEREYHLPTEELLFDARSRFGELELNFGMEYEVRNQLCAILMRRHDLANDNWAGNTPYWVNGLSGLDHLTHSHDSSRINEMRQKNARIPKINFGKYESFRYIKSEPMFYIGEYYGKIFVK